MKVRLLAAATIALLTAAVVAGLAGAAPVELTANMNGAKEVPGPGDPNGEGTADVTLKRKRQKVCFHIEYSNILTAFAGHIHKGRAGVAGPIKVTLFDTPETSPVDDCVRDVSKRLIGGIAEHPRRFYVNLHNATFPDGAIRGQLKRAPGY
jgi:hypothetical protein